MHEDKLVVSFSKEIYEKEAVLASAYLITNKYNINITSNDSCYLAEITSKDSCRVPVELIRSLENECIDQQLRLDLEKKTGKIRELIVEHAFKPLDLRVAIGGNDAR